MVYIGMTKKHLTVRWNGHVASRNSRLGAAIAERPNGAFAVISMASAVGRTNARLVEDILIRQWETQAPKGYNSTIPREPGLVRQPIRRVSDYSQPHAHTTGEMGLDPHDINYYRSDLVPTPENGSAPMTVEDKRCRKCGMRKPLRAFDLARHRLCSDCRTHANLAAAERWAATYVPATVAPTEAEIWAASQSGVDTSAKVPALTTTYIGFKKWMNERKRRETIDRENAARAAGKPVKTPTYRSHKLCVRCKHVKHSSQFPHPRYRICLACDGPPLT